MRLTEALKMTRGEVENALLSLKYKNGEQLATDELKKLRSDQIVFWINRGKIDDTARSIFVVVKIQRPAPLDKADGKVAFRELSAYIDVVTSKTDADPKLTKEIERIEKAFLDRGWAFEMVRNAETDELSEKTVWSFEISKTL